MESRVEQLFTQSTPAEIDADRDDILLSEDPAAWQAEVHQALVQTVALPPEAIPMVEVQMEDEDQSDASGAVTIDVHGQQLVVPVVIRQGSLAPMDTFFVQGKEEDIRPLTTQNVNELMAQGQYDYQAVSRPGSGGNGSLVDEALLGDQGGQLNSLQGPFGSEYGQSKYASSASSFIEDLIEHGGISDELGEKVASEVDDDLFRQFEELPNTSTAFGEAVYTSGVSKVASGLACLRRDRDHAATHGRRDVPPQHEMNPARLAATDVYQIRMMGPGKYRLHATCDRVFIPIVRDLSGSEVRSLLENLSSRYSRRERVDVGAVVQGLVRRLMGCGEVTIVTRSNATKPAVLWPNRSVAEDVAQFARYHVRQEGGLGDIGVAIPKVYDCDGGRLPCALFISEKTSNWSMQESIVGVKEDLSASFLDLERLDDPSGQKVVLAWLGADEEPCCLPPMDVERVEVSGDDVEIVGRTGLGDPVRLICDDLVRHPIASPGDDGVDDAGRRVYLFPKAHAAIRVCRRREYATTSASFEKMGSAPEGSRELKLVPTQSGGFNVKLGSFQADDMPRNDTRLLLATCGASRSESRLLLDKAAEAFPNGLTVNSMLVEPIVTEEEVDKLASIGDRKPTDEERAAVQGIRDAIGSTDVVKLAAGMPDSAAADRVLTTRFITEENVTLFKRYLPEFRKTVSRLGRLLLFARLSGQLDEASIKRAMMLMDQVIRAVQQLTQTAVDDAYA